MKRILKRLYYSMIRFMEKSAYYQIARTYRHEYPNESLEQIADRIKNGTFKIRGYR